MKARELISLLEPLNSYSPLKDFTVKGISCNSKNIGEGFIFVAIKGAHQDGNKFIDESVERGARAIIIQSTNKKIAFGDNFKRFSQWLGKYFYTFLYQDKVLRTKKVPFILVKDTRKALAILAAQFYGNPSKKVKVVGITGTNGKTTITYLIEALLKEAKALPAVVGTINYRFKDKVIPAKNTTPGPVELQSLLSEMLKEKITHCIMEVSSHSLDQERVRGIEFHSAIFTNLTQDHLDYHRTIENYFQAKAKLFKNISTASFIVLNRDDKFGRRLKRLAKAKVITYAIESAADVVAKDIKFNHLGMQLRVAIPQGEIKLNTLLIGKHNVYNILAAIAWGLKEGLGLGLIKSALEKFYFVPGRLERINSKGGFSVFVDYAHTEDALKNAIQALKGLPQSKRVIVVFGCGGERDKTKRPKMGRVVSELANYAVITSDNPRSEKPLDIIKDIKRGIKKDNFCVIPERAEAIKKSLRLAKTGDIVLLAGKGHEDYQVLKDKILHFDDREAVRECLKSMHY